MGYIFLSYSHKNSDYAHKLYQYLFEHSLDAWLDDRVNYGSNWPNEIERRLRECSVFILIMSQSAKDSDWVQNELNLARELKKTIYPLLLDGEPWWQLNTIQYVDVRDNELPPAKFLVSLANVVNQFQEEKNPKIAITVTGSVQGNIVVGNDNRVVQMSNVNKEKKEFTENTKQATHTNALADKNAHIKDEYSTSTEQVVKTRVEHKNDEKSKILHVISSNQSKDPKRYNAVNFILISILAIFIFLVFVLGNLLRLDNFSTDQYTIGLRLFFVLLALVMVYGIYSNTKNKAIWLIGRYEIIGMIVGTFILSASAWFYNTNILSFGQISFRPTVTIPIFLGYTFGPVVGFFTGAVGNLFGDALTGFGLSPQWSIGNGLVGFIAGLPALFADRRKATDMVLRVGGALAVLATILFFLNRDQPNLIFYDVNNGVFGDQPIAVTAGISVLIGFVLVLVVRFAFAKNVDLGEAVIWGMLGNLLGIGFAAVSDIWINGFSPAAAIVGEFLPAAGPNLIFAAILVPLLVAAYAAVQRQSGR